MDWIGFPQESFTEIWTDCAPAIRMATAPFFQDRNSKNALIQDRNVREAMEDEIVDFVHVLSKDFDADLNAKPSLAPELICKRSTLLNIRDAPHLHKHL